MKKWSNQDDETLIKVYNKIEFSEIINHLSVKRSDNAIRRRAKDLGLTSPKSKEWSKDEIKLLLSDLPLSVISKKLNRTISAINKKRAIEKAKLNVNIDFSKYFDISAIESGVPKINLSSKSAQYLALLSSLAVEQSFEYPTNEKELVRNQIYLIPDRKFETKKWSETTRRVWRVK